MSPSDERSGGIDRFDRADRIFDKALELPADERAAFVASACGDDDELRALVERLLASVEHDDTLLDRGASESPLWSDVVDALDGDPDEDVEPGIAGAEVGRYRVVRRLGSGGMANVYLAERTGSEFEQRVALKILKRGIDTDEVVRKFENERQILANARHPDIAGLIDGGVTDDGRPYLVMEYVEGSPIDEYADGRRLSVDQRLRLFVRVARAVAYAHGNLVVHRDIKPSNILVTTEGDVKLLDFGIAKLLDPDADEKQLTRSRANFLTPAYASPEQVLGNPVGTASDTYQLGLLLYKLLTGYPPYEVDTGSRERLARAVCEQPPTRPSSALSRTGSTTGPRIATPAVEITRVSEARASTPKGLRKKLAGDLDRIVLMTLRKEPERRYGTVLQLVDDIERYLDGLPVSARPDTLAYRTSKFVQRHTAATVAGVLALALLLALPATLIVKNRRITLERDRANVERDRANVEAETSRRVVAFLTEIFEISDPSEARGNTVTAREILDRGAERIETSLEDQPAVRGRLLRVMGEVYRSLGLYPDARPMLERAVELLSEHSGPESGDTLAAQRALAYLLEVRGDLDGARELYEKTLEARLRLYGKDDSETLGTMAHIGNLYRLQGELEESEAILRDAIEHLTRVTGENSMRTLGARSNLATTLNALGRYEECEAENLDILARRREHLGDDHGETQKSVNNLAVLYAILGRFDDAEPLFAESLAHARKLYGERHRQVAIGLSNHGRALALLGRIEEGEAELRQAYALQRDLLGEDHRETLSSLDALANLLMADGRTDEGIAAYRTVLASKRRTHPEGHPGLVPALNNIGRAEMSHGNHAAAIENYSTALAIQREHFGADHPQTITVIDNLALTLAMAGQVDDAAPLFLEALASKRRRFRDDSHPSVMRAIESVLKVHMQRGEVEEGKPYADTLRPLVEALSEDRARERARFGATLEAYDAQAAVEG